MAHPGGKIYYTIKEAIKYSTGEFGCISVYENADGKLYYFVNGIVMMTINAPKKDI
jgi:hypothetical protein